MLETSLAKKNKINLSDYPFQQDVDNRLLMADFSSHDLEVLEEILFSPLKVLKQKIQKNLSCSPAELDASLQKLSTTALLQVDGDNILVDKEMRKYFEFYIERFNPEFKPDMEFVQGLLKKVPIQSLIGWYSIPRSSNNIFESLIEKYLATPHIYQRYLQELNLGDPVLHAIMADLFRSPTLKIASGDLIERYNLTRRQLEEALILLEFHFVCCLCYEKQDDHWVETVSALHEWREYRLFLKDSKIEKIADQKAVHSKAISDFAFIEELGELLVKAQKAPVEMPSDNLVQKLVLVGLAEYQDGTLKVTGAGKDWLELSLENRSMHLYRHPHNRILSLPVAERLVREAEKAVKRISHLDWIDFDEFLKGVFVPLNDQRGVSLKKVAGQWTYALPSYQKEEIELLRATIFEWLYELGMTRIGTIHGKPCFAMTHFGRFFFED